MRAALLTRLCARRPSLTPAMARRSSSSTTCASGGGGGDAFAFVVQSILSALNPTEVGLNAAALAPFARYLSHDVVLEVLRRASRKKGLEFFHWARSTSGASGYRHSAAAYESLIARLCDARDASAALLLLRAMRSDGHQPSIHSLVALLRAYVELGQIDEAGEIFCYVRSAATVPPEAYSSMIDAFARHRRFDDALELSREALSRGIAADHHPLLYALCKADKIDVAAGCLQALLDHNFKVASVDCSVVVDALARADKLEMAAKLLERSVVEAGAKVDSQAFTLLATKLFRRSKFSEVVRLFTLLASRGVVYGETTYKLVVDGLCGAGMANQALELVRELSGVYTPTVFIYNGIITGLCRASRVMDAYKVLEKMVEESIVPNVFTYTILLNGLCRSNKTKLAREVFQEMKRNGCKPNPITYGTLIQHLSRAGEIDEALRVMIEQRSLELPTDVITCTTIVGGLCKASRLDDALKFMEEMRQMGVRPNEVTYSNLVHGFRQHGELDRVIRFFEEEKARKGGSLEAAAYPGYLDALCKAGYLDRARKSVEELRQSGVVPDVVTYSMLINTFARAGQFDASLELLEDMRRNGVKPDVVTYSTLINVLCKERKFQDAFRLLELMEAAGSPPNVVTYNSVMDGLCKSGKMDEVHRVYEMMLKSRCSPDVVTYSIIMNGLSKAGMLDSAVKLFELIKSSREGPDAAAYSMVITSLCRAGKLEEACGMYHGMEVTVAGDNICRALAGLVAALCDAKRTDSARRIVEVARERGHRVTKSGDTDLAKIVEDHLLESKEEHADAEWKA
ncbi:pentatricopeptide repeat-containing protein At1g63330 [Selaginella moellendorffii]|nr:pentatricopeptide repeat-containing protein At1g63330 [Selaginella moellendorffii]XP_024534610.1 pentatricopeptide repeat-containing protein At1g63330 [Selaginella moellendorffii]|eukprot:XP_002974126.2 pentatricopeptide repeat-containing protein At1g63330 [Selaginella moellendorffii]